MPFYFTFPLLLKIDCTNLKIETSNVMICLREKRVKENDLVRLDDDLTVVALT